jgi:hypothetical protein
MSTDATLDWAAAVRTLAAKNAAAKNANVSFFIGRTGKQIPGGMREKNWFAAPARRREIKK